MDDAISRRDFTLRAVLALFSGVAITITGCGDDDGSSDDGSPSPAPTPSTNPGPSTGDVSGVISANHGHTAVISAAQLTAGNALRLDITGSADHTHTVDLSANEVTQIQNRQQVSKTSSTGASHDHMVTFN